MSGPVDRSLFAYAARYCEENVWKLIDSGLATCRCASGTASALFISNVEQGVPLWHQRSAAQPGEPVLWDYHVVALIEGPQPQIWDLDSDLPFPCPALEYLAETFPYAGALPPELEPCFRRVEGPAFRAAFASDRSHMRGEDGAWLAPPPPWPAIRTPGATMNLMEFVEMGEGGPGQIFTLGQLRARLR
jgi:hypothetical protein